MAPKMLSCFGKKPCKHHKTDTAATADESVEEQSRGGGIGDQNGPVLVELFSSQGCKTSPEAELLMSRLGRGDFNLDQPVIILGFHVDYWDYMGWKDPYGSSQWTVRQKDYVEALKLDTMFTPQVVVQGRVHCVGNEEENVLGNIKSAPRFAAPNFQANFQKTEPNTLQVSLTGSLRMKIDNQGANVMVALYQNGLVTDCPKGENKGRVLSSDFVVRKLEKLTSVKDISAKKNISGTVNIPLWEGFNSSKCGLAVFVQNSSHQIFGSQKFDQRRCIFHPFFNLQTRNLEFDFFLEVPFFIIVLGLLHKLQDSCNNILSRSEDSTRGAHAASFGCSCLKLRLQK